MVVILGTDFHNLLYSFLFVNYLTFYAYSAMKYAKLLNHKVPDSIITLLATWPTWPGLFLNNSLINLPNFYLYRQIFIYIIYPYITIIYMYLYSFIYTYIEIFINIFIVDIALFLLVITVLVSYL